MQKNENILNELGTISPHIAALDFSTPFTVPEGYFDAFPSRMMELVKQAANTEKSYLPDSTQLSNPFKVPDNYFENLAGEVLSRIQNHQPGEELQSISPLLAGLEKRNPFSAPEGYFDEMPANVAAGIRAIDFVQSELDILPPALASCKGKNVFEVPPGYFTTLAGDVLGKLKSQAPVVKMQFGRRVLKYAVAAAVVGIIAISAWLYNRNEGGQSANIAAANLDSSLQQLTETELSNYVETNLSVVMPDPGTNAANDLDPQDMHAMLADISDADLEQYLEKYGIVNDDHTN
jgi:hypothetical protein